MGVYVYEDEKLDEIVKNLSKSNGIILKKTLHLPIDNLKILLYSIFKNFINTITTSYI